jgi:deoxyribodipyrimidine photo-lyase
LYHALQKNENVLPIFIFDKNILDDLEDADDSRVSFIYDVISALQEELAKFGSSMLVFHDKPIDVFRHLIKEYSINTVFANHDYERYAIDRDRTVAELLMESSIDFYTFKDQVIFDKKEVLKDDGTPYTVFTPYSRKWRSLLNDFYLASYPCDKYFDNFIKSGRHPVPSLQRIGFKRGRYKIPSNSIADLHLKDYRALRDFPGEDATSRMGIHLRFGTISIRALVRKAKKESDTYLDELVWREFFQMILWHFPHINKGEAFKKEYDAIKWRYDEREFSLWCAGKTGYPIVDAGMRQLNETGFMHNRVRMITASFLAKHLLIDWRWGEAYFARRLLDYDFGSNNGGWQWAVGSGCDAAPYFRIFNPALQTKKFDADLTYVKRWVPEMESFDYPPPMVEHDFARKRCLEAYAKALKK